MLYEKNSITNNQKQTNKQKKTIVSSGSCTLGLNNLEDREQSLAAGPKHPPIHCGGDCSPSHRLLAFSWFTYGAVTLQCARCMDPGQEKEILFCLSQLHK